MSVKVDIKNFDYPDRKWNMVITISCSTPLNFIYTYEFDEPYLYSLERWKKLAGGPDALSLGGLRLFDGYYQLTVGITNPEGEVYSNMRIKKEYLSDVLTEAIHKAMELNLEFACQAPSQE